MTKPFSLYVPKFNNTFSEADVCDAISLLLKTPHYRLKAKDYRETRKHPRIQKMLLEQREEVFDWYWKQDALVEKLVGFAIDRMQRDHDGYAYEAEIEALRAFARKAKNKILHVAWCQAHGQRWRDWKHHKADMDEALGVIFNYRKSPDWEQPWTVFFKWNGGLYPRTLAPVKRKPRRWNPEAKIPAVPKGENTAHIVHHFPGYENISFPDKN